MGIGNNGRERVTMSKPIVHAFFLTKFAEWLARSDISGHQNLEVLDVGSGTGYLTVALAVLLDRSGTEGSVVGIDISDELVALGTRNFSVKDARSRDSLENVKVIFRR